MRNLIQNAVDFATSNVWVEADWTDSEVSIRIIDDGPGFPTHILGRIGDPFIQAQRASSTPPSRPEYEGMGLGLFIAKTLLERSGATLRFANGPDDLSKEAGNLRIGAVVEVVWPRDAIDARHLMADQYAGNSQPIEL